MIKEIAVICNSLNPLIKIESGLEGYWIDILNTLHYLNNKETTVDVRNRLKINNFVLTSREILQITDINKDEHHDVEAFGLFLYYKINKEDHEIPFITDLIKDILHDQREYKKKVKTFVDDSEQNYLCHNFAVSNERLIKFINKLFVLFSLDLYKPHKTKSNSQLFKEFQSFVADYEFNKQQYKSN